MKEVPPKFPSLANLAAKVVSPVKKDQFPIFVFGPYLLPEDVVRKPRSDSSLKQHSLFVRYQTKTQLESNGFTVHFGENKDVMNLWESHLHLTDTATTEISHANGACGAIVIFASSIGSFCELGLFASYGHIISKTIVIIDKQFESHKSFLNEGLVKIVKQENGQVAYCDYKDHKKCADTALEFVEGKFTKLQRHLLQIADAAAKMKSLPITVNVHTQ